MIVDISYREIWISEIWIVQRSKLLIYATHFSRGYRLVFPWLPIVKWNQTHIFRVEEHWRKKGKQEFICFYYVWQTKLNASDIFQSKPFQNWLILETNSGKVKLTVENLSLSGLMWVSQLNQYAVQLFT